MTGDEYCPVELLVANAEAPWNEDVAKCGETEPTLSQDGVGLVIKDSTGKSCAPANAATGLIKSGNKEQKIEAPKPESITDRGVVIHRAKNAMRGLEVHELFTMLRWVLQRIEKRIFNLGETGKL